MIIFPLEDINKYIIICFDNIPVGGLETYYLFIHLSYPKYLIKFWGVVAWGWSVGPLSLTPLKIT